MQLDLGLKLNGIEHTPYAHGLSRSRKIVIPKSERHSPLYYLLYISHKLYLAYTLIFSFFCGQFILYHILELCKLSVSS